MYNFAYNLYQLLYLKATDQLREETLETVLDGMNLGILIESTITNRSKILTCLQVEQTSANISFYIVSSVTTNILQSTSLHFKVYKDKWVT